MPTAETNTPNLPAPVPAVTTTSYVRIERSPGDHPLQSAWCFWYDQKKRKVAAPSDFREQLQKVGTFDTVEGFWKIYCYLRRPSTLVLKLFNSRYYIVLLY